MRLVNPPRRSKPLRAAHQAAAVAEAQDRRLPTTGVAPAAAGRPTVAGRVDGPKVQGNPPLKNPSGQVHGRMYAIAQCRRLDHMIEVKGLTRTCGDYTAVDDVGFSCEPGRVTGFFRTECAEAGLNPAETSTLTCLRGPVRRRSHASCRLGSARTPQAATIVDASAPTFRPAYERGDVAASRGLR